LKVTSDFSCNTVLVTFQSCIIVDGTGSNVCFNKTWTETKSAHILPDITENNNTVYIAVSCKKH